MGEEDTQPLHRGSGGGMYTRKARATREAPCVIRDDQPDTREGQASRPLSPRSKDRIIARGQRLIEQAIAEMEKTLPAVPDKSLEQQSDAELFAGNFRRSLLFSRDVLDRPDDWGDMEFMKMKRDIAISVQSAVDSH